MAGSSQRGIDKGADDSAGDNIAEVTERHRNGGRDLADDIERGEHRDGLGVALEVAANAIGLDLGGGDEHKHQYCPGQLGGKIGRGRKDPQQPGKAGKQRKRKDSGHKRRIVGKARAHIAIYKVLGGIDQKLGDGLPGGDMIDPQIMGEPNAEQGKQQHDAPGDHQRGRKGNAAEDGQCGKNRGTIDLYIHAAGASFGCGL